jgi:hypothetical protein
MFGFSGINKHVKEIQDCNLLVEHKSRNVEMKLEPLKQLVKAWSKHEEQHKNEQSLS